MNRRLGPTSGRGAFFVFPEPALTLTLLHDAPKQIIAGDSIEFLVAIPGDLSGWTGSARLTGPTATMAGVVATENNDFHVTFSGQGSPGTKSLTAGQYLLTVWATNGNDRYTVAQYPITVTADLSTGTPAQLHAQQMLVVIETAIYNRINGTTDGGIEGYSIDGTAVTKIPLEQLHKLRARYAAEVARLQNPGSPLPRAKFVMTPAGTVPEMRRRYGTP